MAKRFWLFKSDPDTFGLSHLRRCRNRTTMWDGIRNYQARNLIRDEVSEGDGVLFYHSQIQPPEVVAIARVVRAAYPDPTQFRPKEKYYDPKAVRSDPRWFAVDIRLEEVFNSSVTLPTIKQTPGLAEMKLVQHSRLSVQPVTPAEWKIITAMGKG